MSEGPTTVGSIIAKIKADRSEWEADVAKTKADIRDLEGKNPTIKVDANAGGAIAEMKATAAAADVLGAKELELGEKTRASADESRKANVVHAAAFTRIQAIATAVAVLLPLLAPVGAAAIGLGGAFLGMGAAGVLALIGINREMKDGTSTGAAYREGVDELHGSLDTLSHTAAVNMLSSFRRIVAETREEMPALNTQVGQFSGILGRSGGNLFTGAITALRVLNPLFLTGAVYLESLTRGFKDWTQSGGLEQFGGYALSMLPKVTDLLGKLASTVMHILEALAPLGAVGMAVLGGIADVISSIPVQVLSDLIVTVTWGAIAFKAWAFISPMLAAIATNMGAVGVATELTAGPIGWVVAGLSALAGVIAVTIASQNSATDATKDYTAALHADNGAIGENVRLTAAKRLQDAGAFAMAKQLGISYDTLVGAVLRQPDALAKVKAAQERVNGEYDRTHQSAIIAGADNQKAAGEATQKKAWMRDLVALLGVQADGLVDTTNKQRDLDAASRVATGTTQAQTAANEAAAAALGITTGALATADTSQGTLKEQADRTTAAMYIQGDAAGLLKDSLDRLNGKTLSAEESQNRFEAALNRMPDATDAAGASLSGMSDSAVTNRGAIIDLVKSAEDSAQAYRDQGHSSDEAKQKLIDSKQAIEDTAVLHGINRDAVHGYLDQLFKIPDSIPKTKVEVDVDSAKAKLNALISGYQDQTITLRALVHGVDGHASGGTISAFAGGGTAYGPGTAKSDSILTRLSVGEEVIQEPYASRNRGLLKQINAGVTFAPTIAGRVSAAPAAAGGASGRPQVVHNHNHSWNISGENPEQIYFMVKNRLAQDFSTSSAG